MTYLACDPNELRTLFLFEKLTDDQLGWLCREGHIELMEPGWVYREGDPASCFFVLIEGDVVLSRLVGEDDVEVSRTSQRGVYGGAFQSYLGDRIRQVYLNSMRATSPSRFFVLDAQKFTELMNEWFPMALHMLEGLFFGNQNVQQATAQRERLLALGSLSAGLTHELNNPAAAAVRATEALRGRVAGMRSKLALISTGDIDRTTLAALVALQEDAVEHVAKAPTLSPMETSDREEAIGEWLTARGVSDGWDLAPTFVQAGLDEDFLEHVATATGDEARLEGAVRWINYSVETELLMDEIHDATTRISTLVGAAKQYSQMDRAAFQVVNIHELLKSTLMMMSGKLRDVKVVKDFDRTLPPVPVYAAELNQVWTNLIDNAVGAMPGGGTLTIRTAREGERVLVEIGDTGSGIPPEVQKRIFEPFFTTKPMGEGTGLGLDIAWRIVVNKHHGDLRVESVPGDTRFQIRLPLTVPDRA
jgi:signal transduction histidine kinase